jgi:hypothetical protein
MDKHGLGALTTVCVLVAAALALAEWMGVGP